MSVATTPDTSVIDIPFLIRGRIIEPDADDSVEWGGRVGARFRTPDAVRHAADLVLKNPSALRDLHDTPIDEVIQRGLVEPLFRIWDRGSNSIVAEFDFAILKDEWQCD